jgi:hypothetical protein
VLELVVGNLLDLAVVALGDELQVGLAVLVPAHALIDDLQAAGRIISRPLLAEVIPLRPGRSNQPGGLPAPVESADRPEADRARVGADC